MKRHVESHNMPVTVDDFAQKWAADLGRAEADRSGHSLPVACRIVARRLGLPITAVNNIRRGRIKSVSARAVESLRAAIINKIHTEMQALQHELEIAQRSSTNPGDADILAAKAALEEARKILKGEG